MAHVVPGLAGRETCFVLLYQEFIMTYILPGAKGRDTIAGICDIRNIE